MLRPSPDAVGRERASDVIVEVVIISHNNVRRHPEPKKKKQEMGQGKGSVLGMVSQQPTVRML